MKKLSPAEIFLDHFNRILRREPELYLEPSLEEGIPGVTSLVYKDYPQPGFVTGISYGLSLQNNPEWSSSVRREVCICVKSENIDWAKLAGSITNKLRGKWAFSYGQVINLGSPFMGESLIDAFIISTPSIFEKKDYVEIDIALDYKIELVELYPVYSDELPLYRQLGTQKFISRLGNEVFNLNRKPIVI